jgi:hypothetical protein
MSSNLLKILRSLKGNSSHHDNYGHNDHYRNYQDVNHGYDNHYKSHGKHFFSGLAFKTVQELSGKLFQNKRLALLAIIAFLTISVIILGFAVWLVVILIKLCGPLISDLEKNGLKSAVDTLMKIVARIWEGTGK